MFYKICEFYRMSYYIIGCQLDDGLNKFKIIKIISVNELSSFYEVYVQFGRHKGEVR